MDTENNNNKLIKGLWKISEIKSSDYIKLVKSIYLDATGSRLRGLMSSLSNKNYRPATIEDVHQCLVSLCNWAKVDPPSLDELSLSKINCLLAEVNNAIKSPCKDSNKEKIEKVVRKLF